MSQKSEQGWIFWMWHLTILHILLQEPCSPHLPPPFRYHNPKLCYPRKFWNISVIEILMGFSLEQKPSCFCYQNEMISLNNWVMIWCINQQLNHLFQGKYTILQLVKKKLLTAIRSNISYFGEDSHFCVILLVEI